MKELPNEQQLFSSKDGSEWIPHLDGKQRTDIGDWLHQNLTWDEFQAIVNPPKSEDDILLEQAKNEHAWVISELDNAQVELMYHWTGDTSRAVATEQDWKDYVIALRNYTTTDNNGNPTLNNSTRPESPRQ